MTKPVKKEDAAAATANVADDTASAADGAGGAADATAPTGAGMQQQVKETLTSALADIAEKVVALARSCVSSLEGHGSLKYLRDPKRLIAEQMAELGRRRAGEARYLFGLPGFDDYTDGPNTGQPRIVVGAIPGDVSVVTGLPSSGKTTVTARLAVEQANLERRTVFGAWEQGSGLTLELCASISLGISRTALSIGDFDAETEELVRLEMERLSEWIRFIELPFDRGRAEEGRPDELNNRHIDTLYEYIVATAPDVAIFDLWNRVLVTADPDKESQMLYRQQAMMQATKCHGILIHQQRSKDILQRDDKTPTVDALKGTGGWHEVPANIFGVHREFLHKNVPDDTIKIVILKQRKGVAPLAVEFPWDADKGWIGQGRCAEFVRPGQRTELDSFIGGEVTPIQMAKMKEEKRQTKRKRL